MEASAYELVQKRLGKAAAELRARIAALNEARRATFGASDFALAATERVTTAHNCVPRDMTPFGPNRFVFGYNVRIGLKSETEVEDVFCAYEFRDSAFHSTDASFLHDPKFREDFRSLYKYYKETAFTKFRIIPPYLFMAFQVGKTVQDIKTFRWLRADDGSLQYAGNRSDHEFKFPAQHEFEWRRTHRDLHRHGKHPHIAIDDRVFVETVGGDLTIKIENNTDTGQGIYAEPVDNPDQTLDDAEIHYALVGKLILLRIRPYQEKAARYLIFNDRLKTVRRVDALEHACVLLPEDHGIVFPCGFYLESGDCKVFDSHLGPMIFSRRIPAPNGEDHLFVFHDRMSGTYALLNYNIISRDVAAPFICHGYTFLTSGELLLFRASDEPQKHHAIQIWRTPFDSSPAAPTAVPEANPFLLKVGNHDIVRCMAECQEVLQLASREEPYESLFIDLNKKAGDILDSYPWLRQPAPQDSADFQPPGAFGLRAALDTVKDAASAAIGEFEKVVRIRRETAHRIDDAERRTRDALSAIAGVPLESVAAFVTHLATLRGLRGEIVSLRELRYADVPRIDSFEQSVARATEELGHRCAAFLLQPEALAPVRATIEGHDAAVPQVAKVAEARALEASMTETASQLELLLEIIGSLRIEDATQSTQILESVSVLFASLNRAKAALHTKRRSLADRESAAQFQAQLKLLEQSAAGLLDMAETIAKCEEALTKLLVRIEELEGLFAESDECLAQLADKRDELVNAFESRKVALQDARTRRAARLLTAADRLFHTIGHRTASLPSLDAINGFFAADLMVEKVRGIVNDLLALDDTVKASDLQARLKTLRDEAVRQWRDRHDLFVEGASAVRFGRHVFTVNTQPLDLTLVPHGDGLAFHLTGTHYFVPARDEAFAVDRALWDQEWPSENASVARAEFATWRLFSELHAAPHGLDAFLALAPEAALARVQEFLAPRFREGYTKGVHDLDVRALLTALAQLHRDLGPLRHASAARAAAVLYWKLESDIPWRTAFTAKLRSLGLARDLLHPAVPVTAYVEELRARIEAAAATVPLFPRECPDRSNLAREAALYLCEELAAGSHFALAAEANRLRTDFEATLRTQNAHARFEQCRAAIAADPLHAIDALRDWLDAYLAAHPAGDGAAFRDEATALLFGAYPSLAAVQTVRSACTLGPLLSAHPTFPADAYRLDYHDFVRRLSAYDRDVLPAYERFHRRKGESIESERRRLRLTEFEPRVMSAFVRNRLIDEVYLPLIGDNLAKQLGVAGETTRTDRMGLLLLISPPGYGKTTLMEYIASRLGLTFVKVNGPALGHAVTSLDPQDAPNAAARQEVERINLALEMGDNLMLYLDDIQHCDPELLQKFISLCDAQRRIEGVFQGQPRTYDLRGRKVAVVMVGNPYTESGAQFKIPDMLANRADTYNLGDILGGNERAFQLSYLENALTSNPLLAGLANKPRSDLHRLIQMAETGSAEGVTFESTLDAQEINDAVAVFRHLIQLRNALLAVNREYIRSAAQADAFRTEPPFKLQGSYRNMNRLAEKVVPLMTDAERDALLLDHYTHEAQTLAVQAESNLLKLRELLGWLDPQAAQRWTEIKNAFQRNLRFGAATDSDPVGRVVVQIAAVEDALARLGTIVQNAATHPAQPPASSFDPDLARELAGTLAAALERTARLPSPASVPAPAPAPAEATTGLSRSGADAYEVEVRYKLPDEFYTLIQQQNAIILTLLDPVVQIAGLETPEMREYRDRIQRALKEYRNFIRGLEPL